MLWEFVVVCVYFVFVYVFTFRVFVCMCIYGRSHAFPIGISLLQINIFVIRTIGFFSNGICDTGI